MKVFSKNNKINKGYCKRSRDVIIHLIDSDDWKHHNYEGVEIISIIGVYKHKNKDEYYDDWIRLDIEEDVFDDVIDKFNYLNEDLLVSVNLSEYKSNIGNNILKGVIGSVKQIKKNT